MDLAEPSAAEELARSLREPRSPLLFVASGRPILGAPAVEALLAHPYPVAGLLLRPVRGPWAEALLACDLLWGGPGTLLRFPPGGVWPALLSLRVGAVGAARVAFAGGALSFAEAFQAGWCRAAPAARDEALAVGERLFTSHSPGALRLLRPLLYRERGLAAAGALALERHAFALAWELPDAKEGVAGFLEKRPLRFRTAR